MDYVAIAKDEGIQISEHEPTNLDIESNIASEEDEAISILKKNLFV